MPFPHRASCAKSPTFAGEMTGGISVAVAVGKGIGEGVGTAMATGPQASDAATSRAAFEPPESPLDLISILSDILANWEQSHYGQAVLCPAERVVAPDSDGLVWEVCTVVEEARQSAHPRPLGWISALTSCLERNVAKAVSHSSSS